MSDLTVVRRPDGNLDVTMGNLQVVVRPQDGWINATELAISAGKRVFNWTSLKGTEKTIKKFAEKVGGPVIETIHGDGGKTWMHLKLALQFAQWLSTDYAWFVSEVMEGYHTGRLEVAAQVMENHDQINQTQTQALLVTRPNDEPIEVTRRIAKERTKRASSALAAAGFGPYEMAIKNNNINKSVFGFSGNTRDFRKELGIGEKETPRNYADRDHLKLVTAMEASYERLCLTNPNDDKYDLLKKVEESAGLVFRFAQITGVHQAPMRTLPIEDIPASEVPEEERFLGPEQFSHLISN